MPEELSCVQEPHKTLRKICVMGAGHVGTTTSAVLAYQNRSCQIKVVDVNGDRIQSWNSSRPPIFESGLQELLSEVRSGTDLFKNSQFFRTMISQRQLNGHEGPRAEDGIFVSRKPNLTFATNIADAIAESDVIFICVDTPALVDLSNLKHFDMDLTKHDHALRMIAEFSVGHTIVVEKSTVPCGTSQRSGDFLANFTSPKASFDILSNPEYLAQGTSINDLLYPDRVVIGFDQKDPAAMSACDALCGLYLPWVPQNRVITMSLFSSEVAKLAHNAFLAQRVSSINSLAAICEAGGGDVTDVSHALGMNNRIGSKYLQASFGFGGSCLVKDTASLAYFANSLGITEVSDYWRQVLLLNEYQKTRFAERIITRFGGNLHRERIAVLGFAYKRETRDTRGTPAGDVVLQLINHGALVALYDPHASEIQIQQQLKDQYGDPGVSRGTESGLIVYRSVYDACYDARATVVLNDIPEFDNGETPTPINTNHTTQNEAEIKTGKAHHTGSINWGRIAQSMREPRYLFDGKGALNTRLLEQQGFIVEVVGR